MGEFIEQFGGWIVGLVTVIGTLIYNKRKIQIDESALVLAKWKELAAQMDAMATRHETEMRELRGELKAERDESTKLRARVRELEDEVAGLRRAIAQTSKSAAMRIGDFNAPSSDARFSDDIEKLDRAGDNSRKGRDK